MPGSPQVCDGRDSAEYLANITAAELRGRQYMQAASNRKRRRRGLGKGEARCFPPWVVLDMTLWANLSGVSLKYACKRCMSQNGVRKHGTSLFRELFARETQRVTTDNYFERFPYMSLGVKNSGACFMLRKPHILASLTLDHKPLGVSR